MLSFRLQVHPQSRLLHLWHLYVLVLCLSYSNATQTRFKSTSKQNRVIRLGAEIPTIVADENDAKMNVLQSHGQYNIDAVVNAKNATFTDPATLFNKTEDMKKLALPKFSTTSPIYNTKPIPTNKWWGNLIAYDEFDLYGAVWSNPYSQKVEPSGIQFGFPVAYRVFGGKSNNTNANKFYYHDIKFDFTLTATEFIATPNSTSTISIVDWDDIGVQVEIKSGGSVGKLKSSLVAGMAFVSGDYSNLKPVIKTNHDIVSINDATIKVGTTISPATKFTIKLNNTQTWVMYTKEAVGMTAQSLTQLESNSVFNGVVRVAMVHNGSSTSCYDSYHQCVVQGAMSNVVSESQYDLKWQTSGDCSNGLLHFGLPHHKDSLLTTSAKPVEMEAESTTRGIMQAYVTQTTPPVWQFKENGAKIPIDFYPSKKPSIDVLNQYKFQSVLEKEVLSPWTMAPKTGSYYFNGKSAQKYGSLCLIAKDCQNSGKNVTSMLSKCVENFRQYLTPFVKNDWTYPLQYDAVYKGIVSSEGFVKNDVNADFGNTIYNDHHYHYGYWIAAAALMNHLDPSWSELPKLNEITDFLIRDVANEAQNDPYFPRFRGFDWFKGHTYSHGVTLVADGKDEESTSEDVNFHYALALYGKATKNTQLEKLGRMMLQLNANAIQTYFLFEDSNTVHPPSMRANKVSGIFFDNKVDYATWFCSKKYCIHGIQMIPVSPVTQFVRTKKFVKEEWDQILSKEEIVTSNNYTNAWLSLLYANYAQIDPLTALKHLEKAKVDDGLTRSWAMYIAASYQQ